MGRGSAQPRLFMLLPHYQLFPQPLFILLFKGKEAKLTEQSNSSLQQGGASQQLLQTTALPVHLSQAWHVHRGERTTFRSQSCPALPPYGSWALNLAVQLGGKWLCSLSHLIASHRSYEQLTIGIYQNNRDLGDKATTQSFWKVRPQSEAGPLMARASLVKEPPSIESCPRGRPHGHFHCSTD